MHGFMPSDIARLVLGYLEETGCKIASKKFLSESCHLREFAQCLKDGYGHSTSIEGRTLIECLRDYYLLSHVGAGETGLNLLNEKLGNTFTNLKVLLGPQNDDDKPKPKLHNFTHPNINKVSKIRSKRKVSNCLLNLARKSALKKDLNVEIKPKTIAISTQTEGLILATIALQTECEKVLEKIERDTQTDNSILPVNKTENCCQTDTIVEVSVENLVILQNGGQTSLSRENISDLISGHKQNSIPKSTSEAIKNGLMEKLYINTANANSVGSATKSEVPQTPTRSSPDSVFSSPLTPKVLKSASSVRRNLIESLPRHESSRQETPEESWSMLNGKTRQLLSSNNSTPIKTPQKSAPVTPATPLDDITPLNSVQPDLPTRLPALSSPRYELSQRRALESTSTPNKDYSAALDANFCSPRRKSQIPRRRLLGQSPSTSGRLDTPQKVTPTPTKNDEYIDYSSILEELLNYPPLFEKIAENINHVNALETEAEKAAKVAEQLEANRIQNIYEKTHSDPVFEDALNLLLDKKLHRNSDQNMPESDQNMHSPQTPSIATDSQPPSVHSEAPGSVSTPSPHVELTTIQPLEPLMMPNSVWISSEIDQVEHCVIEASNVNYIMPPFNNGGTIGTAFDTTEFGTCIRVLNQPIMSTLGGVTKPNITPVKITIPDFHYLTISPNQLYGMPVTMVEQQMNTKEKLGIPVAMVEQQITTKEKLPVKTVKPKVPNIISTSPKSKKMPNIIQKTTLTNAGFKPRPSAKPVNMLIAKPNPTPTDSKIINKRLTNTHVRALDFGTQPQFPPPVLDRPKEIATKQTEKLNAHSVTVDPRAILNRKPQINMSNQAIHKVMVSIPTKSDDEVAATLVSLVDSVPHPLPPAKKKKRERKGVKRKEQEKTDPEDEKNPECVNKKMLKSMNVAKFLDKVHSSCGK